LGDAKNRTIVTAGRQVPQGASTTTLQVYSRETIVDITVTDSEGNPVRGLTQSDFTIKEDGRPQSVRSFKESTQRTAAAARSFPKLPLGVYTNAQSVPPDGPVNIILLDLLNTPDPARMEIVKQGVASYLRTMPPGAQVAVFELSPKKGLRLLQGFTANGALAAGSVVGLDVEQVPLRWAVWPVT
jgi:VWFA-related protein